MSDKGQEGEKYVNELAFNSYLDYWCYPNPKDLLGDKKEICDLLIIFRETVIIISIKNYENKGNYERYKKNVIEKSTKQLYGAERKLFNSNRNIEISHHKRGNQLFDRSLIKNIFRLTINVGEQFEFYDLGDIKENKGFINIFNKDTFEKIIQELDTIPDLVNYLIERERFLKHYEEIDLKSKECDLLAIYLRNIRKFPEEYYNSNNSKISIDLTNAWNDYDKHIKVAKKREEDKFSYFIDKIVKEDILEIENGEILANELMSLTRMNRRYIAKALLTLIAKHQKDDEVELARRYLNFNDDIGYLFIYYSDKITAPREELDLMIFDIAPSLYSYKTNCKNKYLIVLAGNDYLKQWKYGLFIPPEYPFSEDAVYYFEEIIKGLGWFTDMKEFRYQENEYPD